MQKGITVVTFTLDRLDNLDRCIKSVSKCHSDLPIKHLVVSKYSGLLQPRFQDQRIQWITLDNEILERPIGRRMAELRNIALGYVETNYCSFLDDDNTVEEEHFQKLLDVIRMDNCAFSYSYRKVFEANGKPFEGERYPWFPPGSRERKIYEWCLSRKVIEENNNIIYDGPIVDNSPFNVSTVDMNEWLFHTAMLISLGFDCDFSASDLKNNIGEDDKLLAKILSYGLPIISSKQATLNYYLGGYSNY